jgi:hypothetical protein
MAPTSGQVPRVEEALGMDLESRFMVYRSNPLPD